MPLFSGEEHVARWCAQWSQPRGAPLTIDQAWRLARAWCQNKMDPGWRRATLEETGRLMASLGLSGPFRDLR